MVSLNKNNYIFNNSNNFLFALLPFFLITGPFLSDLYISITSLLFIIFCFRTKNFYYFTQKPFKIFILFCIFCIFCSLFADDIKLSLKSSIFYFRVGVFCCFVWYLIDKNQKVLTYFYYGMIICFLALVMDGFYQYFTGKNILGYKYSGHRISSFFGDELIMGSYLSRLFPLMFALFVIKKKNSIEVYFIAFLFILVDILIFLSGERAAFFYLNLSTIFIIILIKKYQIFRLITFLVAIGCISIMSLKSPGLLNRMAIVPLQDMGIIKSQKEPTIFSPLHDSHIRTALNMFKDKPIIGHGPKMFRVKCSDPRYVSGKWPCNTHPHNFYIQLLAETGLIGFSFLILAFCYVLYCSYKQLISIILKKKDI